MATFKVGDMVTVEGFGIAKITRVENKFDCIRYYFSDRNGRHSWNFEENIKHYNGTPFKVKTMRPGCLVMEDSSMEILPNMKRKYSVKEITNNMAVVITGPFETIKIHISCLRVVK